MHVVRDDEEAKGLAKEIEGRIPDGFIDFEFGDLYVVCSCGYEHCFLKGVEGIRIDLPATNKHELKIVCGKCRHELKLCYKESLNKEELRAIRDAKKEIAEVKGTEINESGNIEQPQAGGYPGDEGGEVKD